jgi:hypothetical protein
MKKESLIRGALAGALEVGWQSGAVGEYAYSMGKDLGCGIMERAGPRQ